MKRHFSEQNAPRINMMKKMKELAPEIWKNVPLPIIDGFKTMQSAILEL